MDCREIGKDVTLHEPVGGGGIHELTCQEARTKFTSVLWDQPGMGPRCAGIHCKELQAVHQDDQWKGCGTKTEDSTEATLLPRKPLSGDLFL